MSAKTWFAAAAAAGLFFGGVFAASAAIPSAEEAPVANLQGGIIAELMGTAGDKEDIKDAIVSATTGAPLDLIVQAVCPLLGADLNEVFGGDTASIAQAQATLARPEVVEGVSEICETAQVALAQFGPTGGVRGRAGNRPPPGQIGPPGGGGGSGYGN